MDVFAKEKLEKTKIDKLFDGTTVYLVDGKYVRDHMGIEAIDFIYGGHGYVYKFIPKDEIWIEKMFHPHEQALWVVHEIFEWLQMKYMGKPYEPSHEKADTVEHVVRLMLNATSRLRKLLAADRPGMNSNKTHKMPSIQPSIKPPSSTVTRFPVKGMQGWLLKHLNGDRVASVITMLEHPGNKAETDELINSLGRKYDHPRMQFPTENVVNISYKPGKSAIAKPYFVTWDVDKGEIDVYLLYKANARFFASIEHLRRVIQAKTDDKAKSKPAKVTEIADAIRRDNPDTSDEAAYRMAWETYCSYTNPGYEGCTSKGKSHRESPKEDYADK